MANFYWSPFPTKRSAKTPQEIRGKFGAKFGAKMRDENLKNSGNFRSAAFLIMFLCVRVSGKSQRFPAWIFAVAIVKKRATGCTQGMGCQGWCHKIISRYSLHKGMLHLTGKGGMAT